MSKPKQSNGLYVTTESFRTVLKNTLLAGLYVAENEVKRISELIEDDRLDEAYKALQNMGYKGGEIDSWAYDWYVATADNRA